MSPRNVFTLSISTDNAAFGEDGAEPRFELRRILANLGETLVETLTGDEPARGVLRDLNGNTVGEWSLR